MNILIILLIISIVYIIWRNYKNFLDTTSIKSDVDNKYYTIHGRNKKSKEFLKESANTLALINLRIEKLINYLDQTYSKDDNKNYFIKKLKENYSHSMISEAAVDSRYTTYTINKENMHICLRTRDANEKIYDLNLLMYVILHELSHICNYTKYGWPIHGHGEEFRNIFKFLTQEAIKIGIYKYENYHMNPKEYCNIVINSTIL